MYDEILLLRNNFYIYFTYRVYTNHKNIPFISLHLYPVFYFIDFIWQTSYLSKMYFFCGFSNRWLDPVQEGKCYIEISVSVLSKHVFIPSCFRSFWSFVFTGIASRYKGKTPDILLSVSGLQYLTVYVPLTWRHPLQ